MRQIITIITIIIISTTPSFGQRKKYENLIRTYDVLVYTDTIQKKTPSAFWAALRKNNKKLVTLRKAIAKKKKTAMRAINQIEKANKLVSSPYENTSGIRNQDVQQLFQDVYATMGIKESTGFKLHVIDDPTPNAFTTPDRQVYIHSGLLDIEGFTFENLIGVVAHEAAHFTLRHSLEKAYKIQKRLRRNEIETAIAAGAEAWSESYEAARYGSNNTSRHNNINYSSLKELLDKDTYGRYSFKYSREQETEADIIAFRFLEFIGIGGDKYTDALRKVNIDEIASEESDHPSMSDRIQLLEYMGSFKFDHKKKYYYR